MRLKPHEILQKLGFNIGEDGVDVNPADAFLHDNILGFMGATINAAKIPDADLRSLKQGCAFLADIHLSDAGEGDFSKDRAFLSALMQHQFKFQPRKFS